MAISPEPQAEPKLHDPDEVFEDPKFHDDDDDLPPMEEDVPHDVRPVAAKKPERRLPPPRRRFIDD